MKRALKQNFLAAGVLLFLSQGAHAYGINTLGEVDLPIGADGNHAILITTLPQTSDAAVKTGVLRIALDTASTASANEVSMDSKSTGTGNGTSAMDAGLVVNATGGTTNYPAISGGNVGVGTSSPATGMKVHTSGSLKAAGTGSKACSASNIGAMRYNPTGNYLEICSYP